MDQVAAVVVTFNRSELLIGCLNALDSQTRPLDAIFVIDNASSDGTEEVVEAFSRRSRTVVSYFKLEKNVGGAGGFAFGTRAAHSEHYNHLWLMDDDGVPAKDALAELLTVEGPGIRNSLVVDIDNPDQLAFPLSGFPRLKTAQEAKNVSGFLSGSLNPFNGTLVSDVVFNRIGFPDQGFFIWGDEIDFIERARQADFRIGTVPSALHSHPTNKKQPLKLFGRLTVNAVNDDRLHIYIRNYSHNLWRYSGFSAWLKFLLKQLTYEIVERRSWKRFRTALSAAVAGISSFSRDHDANVKRDYVPTVVRSFKNKAEKIDTV